MHDISQSVFHHYTQLQLFEALDFVRALVALRRTNIFVVDKGFTVLSNARRGRDGRNDKSLGRTTITVDEQTYFEQRVWSTRATGTGSSTIHGRWPNRREVTRCTIRGTIPLVVLLVLVFLPRQELDEVGHRAH
jgi:hypothetical protein